MTDAVPKAIPADTTIPADAISAARSAHGDIWYRKRGIYEFLLRCPEAAEFRRYTIATENEGKVVWDAQELIVKHGVVYPARAELDALLEKRPLLTSYLARELAAIGHGLEDEEAKKA